MNKWISVFLFILSPLARAGVLVEPCGYALKPESLEVVWTAFKTTQKVPVKGSFAEMDLLGELESNQGFLPLLNQLEAELFVGSPASVRTGNEGRDYTLFKQFFSKFNQKTKIHGRISNASGDEKKGSFVLNLTLNKKVRPIRMTYTREGDLLKAVGSFSVLEFSLSAALKSLAKACYALHQGPDQISKTWPDVDLTISAKIEQKCQP